MPVGSHVEAKVGRPVFDPSSLLITRTSCTFLAHQCKTHDNQMDVQETPSPAGDIESSLNLDVPSTERADTWREDPAPTPPIVLEALAFVRLSIKLAHSLTSAVSTRLRQSRFRGSLCCNTAARLATTDINHYWATMKIVLLHAPRRSR
ncbi:hypothetical protein PG995_013203 [Apiospora arundinis]